jgi:thiol-disulfide isomerase/thioredoxin
MRLPKLILVAAVVVSIFSPALGATLADPVTGKPVVVKPGARALHLVFFATWCPTCLDELPRLGELEAHWGKQGYQLVLVAIRTRHTAERLAEFIEKERPPGRLLFDVEEEAVRAWEASRLPTHILFDASGREMARSGKLDEKFESAVADLVAEQRGVGRRR